MKKAYLVLQNGRVFEGERIGASCDSIGELVFTTGVVGYLETLTDPAFAGQMVIQTFPLIGNYGVIEADFESKSTPCGYIVREMCDTPSNFRCEGTLDAYLKKAGIPGICGVDTRELTCILREEGTMNAMLCDALPADMDALKAYTATNAVAAVSCAQKAVYPANGERRFAVTLMDFGVKKSVIDTLREYGCEVTVVPYNTAAEDILATNPDGVLLSGGPGDPAENTAAINEIKKLFGKVPLLGVGLGHQLLALSQDGEMEKLKYGHRGANQPVREADSNRTHITGQNHGYVVKAKSLTGTAEGLFINANDGSCEGLIYPDKNAFSVQFEPATFVYDRFFAMMGGAENA